MFVRPLVALVLAIALGGCFGLSAEEPDAEEAPCPVGEGQWPDGSCAPCGANAALIGDACVPCPEGEVLGTTGCEPCDASCEGVDCGGFNACGDRCWACWSVVRSLGPVQEQTEPCPVDPAELDLPNVIPGEAPFPGGRENACVAFDPESDAFLVFGGERLSRWEAESRKCDLPPPNGTGECDYRRNCDLNDSWLVGVDAERNVTFEHRPRATRPRARSSATCVATPEGVLLFGGLFTAVSPQGLSHKGYLPEDLWRWRGGEWTPVETTLGLGELSAALAAWDQEAAELVVVGGCFQMHHILRRICAGAPNGALTCVGPEDIEENRFDWPGGASLVKDPFMDRFLVVGGTPGTIEVVAQDGGRTFEPSCGSESAATGRVWALRRGRDGEKRWVFEELASPNLGAAETASVAAGQNEVLRVGGINRDPEIANDPARESTLDEACLLNAAGTWECVRPLSQLGGPPKRDQATLAWGGSHYLLVGGSGGNGLSSDEFWLYTPAASE